jgi:mono/diheme cytochrome c family protein
VSGIAARGAALSAALVVVSGCGATHPDPAALSRGHAVFRSQCAGCHTLAGEGSPRPVGGDLGGYRMSVSEASTFARIMPTVRRLSKREIADVSAYLVSVQRRRR